ncbi:hypothetical protein ID852_13505 [Xenorhabdus sp. 42]|uniref:hypothetical protein n=1 Tax=Xenorhabdus szentirmaii TaxID=290112 RepID=UPI0019B5C1A9|nr:hypothetical protein [Xenorhabdus sp. 42]MBD2821694.1 hypothetical protein [Xenorhabdus sp. 42]
MKIQLTFLCFINDAIIDIGVVELGNEVYQPVSELTGFFYGAIRGKGDQRRKAG